MEAYIDSLIQIAYKNRRYQKVLLFFCFLTWLNSNIFNTSIEVLSEPSTINDKNVSIKDCQVSPRKRTNIKLYSIVSESDFDCDFIGQLQFKLSSKCGTLLPLEDGVFCALLLKLHVPPEATYHEKRIKPIMINIPTI